MDKDVSFFSAGADQRVQYPKQRAQRRQAAHGLSQKYGNGDEMTIIPIRCLALNCKRASSREADIKLKPELIQPPPWLPSKDGSTRPRGHAPRARACKETAANSVPVLASTSGQEPIPPELANSAATSCPGMRACAADATEASGCSRLAPGSHLQKLRPKDARVAPEGGHTFPHR